MFSKTKITLRVPAIRTKLCLSRLKGSRERYTSPKTNFKLAINHGSQKASNSRNKVIPNCFCVNGSYCKSSKATTKEAIKSYSCQKRMRPLGCWRRSGLPRANCHSILVSFSLGSSHKREIFSRSLPFGTLTETTEPRTKEFNGLMKNGIRGRDLFPNGP